MIRTADRKGNIKKEDSFQNNLLEKIYGSVAGRMMIRPLVPPAVSTVVGKLLDSRISAAAVEPFIRLNHLDMGISLLSGCSFLGGCGILGLAQQIGIGRLESCGMN